MVAKRIVKQTITMIILFNNLPVVPEIQIQKIAGKGIAVKIRKIGRVPLQCIQRIIRSKNGGSLKMICSQGI